MTYFLNSNFRNNEFELMTNDKYFVDKTELIAKINELWGLKDRFVCNTKPIRRDTETMTALLEEVSKRSLNNVVVEQTGCIGVCRLEPIVEVFVPGEEKVTYVKMSPEKVAKIVTEHIVNGSPVAEYTIGAIKE